MGNYKKMIFGISFLALIISIFLLTKRNVPTLERISEPWGASQTDMGYSEKEYQESLLERVKSELADKDISIPLYFKEKDLEKATFNGIQYNPKELDISIIKAINIEKTVNGNKVLVYSDMEDNIHLAYLANNILYYLSQIYDGDIDKNVLKQFTDTIEISEFNDILGVKTGFLVRCVLGASYLKTIYYYADSNGKPCVLTESNCSTYEVDLNSDGQKELIYSQLTPTETFIQRVDNGLLLESYVNDDIVNFLSDLLEINLYIQGVIFNSATSVFTVFLQQETLTISDEIEVSFFYCDSNLFFRSATIY